MKQKLPECTSTQVHSGSIPRSPSFQVAVGKFLFPELFGYPIPPSPGYRTIRSESIIWNVDYTEANFPENLREIRNSGTMLRDFEECLRLWRFAFCSDEQWNHSLEEVSAAELPDNPWPAQMIPMFRSLASGVYYAVNLGNRSSSKMQPGISEAPVYVLGASLYMFRRETFKSGCWARYP